MKNTIIILLFSLSFACSTNSTSKTEGNPENVTDLPAAPGEETPAKSAAKRLVTGRYKGGLKIGVDDKIIFGYYENSHGWNEQVNAPQFSCAYGFTGEYSDSDSIPLALTGQSEASGFLQILSPGRIKVTLTLNPCENEELTTEIWEIEKTYPLVALKKITTTKAYFHSGPDKNSQRKAYLIKDDRVEVTDIKGEWYYVIYEGRQSTTEGWMNASAFSAPPAESLLIGKWVAKAGEAYEVFYKFYPDNRYKTWHINSFEPQGMTGTFVTDDMTQVQLHPCEGSTQEMLMRNATGLEVSFILPGKSTWTAFEKTHSDSPAEEASFTIEKRRIKTTINNQVIYIPAPSTKEDFLKAVCPFDVMQGVISRGEGEFEILNVSSRKKGALFYAIVEGDNVTSIVIEHPVVKGQTVAVGSTYAELKKAIPSATVTRSEIEGKIVGATTDFSYSFGYLVDSLFNPKSKTIPDTARIKQIIL